MKWHFEESKINRQIQGVMKINRKKGIEYSSEYKPLIINVNMS